MLSFTPAMNITWFYTEINSQQQRHGIEMEVHINALIKTKTYVYILSKQHIILVLCKHEQILFTFHRKERDMSATNLYDQTCDS